MSDPKLNVWPNELMIRDTQIVHDDGSGRIYTTTGFGYVKEKYVRAVLVDALRAEAAEHVELLRAIYDDLLVRATAKKGMAITKDGVTVFDLSATTFDRLCAALAATKEA